MTITAGLVNERTTDTGESWARAPLPSPPPPTLVRVALAGCGTVGGAFVRALAATPRSSIDTASP
jgi:hypothetical protein